MTDQGGNFAADDFLDDRPPGSVIGSRTASGAFRLGRDRERGLAIDHGALRIRCLREPGWGRASLSYGPFVARPGLTMAVSMLNGLTTSQTSPHPQGRRAMVLRWLRTFPRVRLRPVVLRENLAVGWFASAVPAAPPVAGTCLVGAASERATGEVLLYGAGTGALVLEGVQNVPVLYILTIREGDVAVYASSQPGTLGFAAHPSMRPIGVVADPVSKGTTVFAGVHQSVLGEVKYRLDTRVYGVRVAPVAELGGRFGSAHVADDLYGDGDLAASVPAVGKPWNVTGGGLSRTAAGAQASSRRALAHVSAASPPGLVRLVARAGSGPGPLQLVWRGDGSARGWRFCIDRGGARLVVHDGSAEQLAAGDRWRLRAGEVHDLQAVDDGATVRLLLDGELVFGRAVADDRLSSFETVGFGVGDPDDGHAALSFEAHPRAVPIPPVLDVGVPPIPGPPAVDTTVDEAVDGFDGAPGDLAGTATADGRHRWRRDLGVGVIVRSGDGTARVDADRARPNPGRTIYTVPWGDPRFADVGVTLIPPGTRRGEGQRCRSGLAFWQDADNHLVLNVFLDDASVGVSISAFLRVDGHEEMYDNDAVWSNVGDRVRPGVPTRLRVACDGERFAAYVGPELVLWRALSDYRPSASHLEIRGVGLVANWEWGDDTGTAFDDFVARSPGPPASPA